MRQRGGAALAGSAGSAQSQGAHGPAQRLGSVNDLRQAWDSPTAEQAERVLENLARPLDHLPPGVSASILEGLDEMLTVIRLGPPDELRCSLGCTNAIESVMAVLRQVCRNVKRWRDARMALRWTVTAMLEAEKSFRRLKAHKQLPILSAALLRHQQTLLGDKLIASKPGTIGFTNTACCCTNFNRHRDALKYQVSGARAPDDRLRLTA